jgi:putative transposase
VSEATYCTWQKKFGDSGVTELKRLKMLDNENARLKRIVADLTLDKQILQEVVRKKLCRLLSGVSWQPGCKSASR